MQRGSHRNRLASETSPYLRQHAGNPVDWYPWGAEALELAKRTGRPILLSIGYTACHWCHVMAHESFESEATAALMNAHFVNIKVDREERPDIDRIYQIAQQMLTQKSGGWPLTMFLTHEDQRPFFGGTYFPNEARYGMPAFGDLLKRVSEYYHQHQGDLREPAQRVQGLGMPVRRPDHRRQVADDERVHDCVQLRHVAVADRQLHPLAADRDRAGARGVDGADAHGRRQPPAAGLDGHEDQP